MINIEFLLVCLIVSEFIDWVFQWSWEANNKSKWSKGDNFRTSLLALWFHSFIYATLTTIIVVLLLELSDQWLLIWGVLLITHVLIDNRITVKWIMRFKGISKEAILDTAKTGFLQLGIDQILHKVVILVLAIFVL